MSQNNALELHKILVEKLSFVLLTPFLSPAWTKICQSQTSKLSIIVLNVYVCVPIFNNLRHSGVIFMSRAFIGSVHTNCQSHFGRLLGRQSHHMIVCIVIVQTKIISLSERKAGFREDFKAIL